ncbi:hypothetical protein [Sedimentitalea nanhaiensis]|uniref:Aspartate carbamoyltransferase catalytic subunit n=1 Tax=Sedimentitalea nanhaiensis TaxID=999627 RepID=A0A1I7CWB5_9RHOB|nr:hypothetical protein [Sedimentitalea nanhaiensis]SFU03666.1 hypothetical protein SAMN05216236_12054 [Sedimentitalea nanhaiensis]
MSEVLTIPAGETGKVRVFALDVPPEQARFLTEPGAVEQMLDSGPLAAPHVEVFPLSDLDELGLTGYLIEGCGIPAGQITPDRARLQALKGHVLLIFSGAFGGRAAQVVLPNTVRPVATYSATPTDWRAGPPISTDSVKLRAGQLQPPRATRARARLIGGGIFALCLGLIALAIYLVMR